MPLLEVGALAGLSLTIFRLRGWYRRLSVAVLIRVVGLEVATLLEAGSLSLAVGVAILVMAIKVTVTQLDVF